MQQGWMYDRNRTVCFSGHRPEKLPDNGNVSSFKMRGILSMLYLEIDQSIKEGYNTFIIGGARGIDLFASEFIMQFSHKYDNINLVVALPYPEFGSNYKSTEMFMRGNAFKEASQIVTVSDRYSSDCYRLRNQFMIDHSSRLIAVVSDYKSGTGQTISYAKKAGIDIKLIDALNFSGVIDESIASDAKLTEEETGLENLIKIYYNI